MRLTGILDAKGLTSEERSALEELLDVYARTRSRNRKLEDYYEGDVMVKDIGVDILPNDADIHVALSCGWAGKAVDSLSSLVRFDGFVFEDGEPDAGLVRALEESCFNAAFSRNRVGMFKKGCMFATVNTVGGHARVRFHSADSAAAVMDVGRERIAYGFAIADARRIPWMDGEYAATQVNLIMPGDRVAIVRDDREVWHAERIPTPDDRPMMEPFVYAPTDTKPMGSSRISKPVIDLVDDVLRVRLAMVLSTAFYSVPLRAILGLSDAMYDKLAESRWGTYLNPMLLATSNKGQVPQLVQLPSNSPEALIRRLENDAELFSGETGVPLNSLGLRKDNPDSAEAIAESRKDLTEEAEDAISLLQGSMRNVALMCMAVESNTTTDRLSDAQKGVMAKFENPAMPSIAARTDAAMKIASVDEGFAGTDVFYEMVGFDQATIARVKAQKRRNQGMLMLQRFAEVDDGAEDTGVADSGV